MKWLATGACALVGMAAPAGGAELAVSRNVWMDPNPRFLATDRYNPGELVPQVEADCAVDPANPDHIVVSAAYFDAALAEPPKHGNWRNRTAGCTLYSTDGGKTWTPVREPFWGEYNLRVAYSRRFGDAYRYGIIGKKWMDIQRSQTHGARWESQQTQAAVDGEFPVDGDHPCLAVDNSPESPFYGRIYVAATKRFLWFNDRRGAPDGYQRCAHRIASGTFMMDDLCVLRNGEVVLAYRQYEKVDGEWPVRFRLRLSADGGRSLSEPAEIVKLPFIPYARPTEPGKVFYPGVGTDSQASFAVDPNTDRFYCAYMNLVEGKQRLFLIHSDDRGKTWSAPVRVSPAAPHASDQFQAQIAVNPRGEPGIVWFDTRLHPGREAYDVYFAFSQDQGVSFQEVRVSSQSSHAVWTFNQEQVPLDQWIVPGFDSRRHLTRGDYIGLAADARGDFVMAWPDCRNDNRQQMYFAEVAVKR